VAVQRTYAVGMQHDITFRAFAISDDMYDKLVSEAGRSLRWFCDQCENAVMQKACIAECHSDKFDQSISTIEKLVD